MPNPSLPNPLDYTPSPPAEGWTLASLRQTMLATLAQTLDGATEVGLVNYPNHGNPGDPALWLGAEVLLKKLGVRIKYRSSYWDFDAKMASRAVGKNPILLQAGGNLGDLYVLQQPTRERVLMEMLANPVIQLPQSIHYVQRENADKFRDIIAAHGDYRLMVRDRNSAALAKELLNLDPILSPDYALAIARPKPRATPPQIGILWNTWGATAKEHVTMADPDPHLVETGQVTWLDWAQGTLPHLPQDFDRIGQYALQLNNYLRTTWPKLIESPIKAQIAQQLAGQTFDPLARRWVARGFAILQDARVVVTNKLHGHLFCVLAGIPHVVLDNSYGKISGILQTWSSSLPGVHVADNATDAYEIASRLLRQMTPR